MRIASIKVKGLFGVFDHEVSLELTQRVTIIHGPNGVGKTVMLKMIAGFFQGDTSIFSHTPFDEFAVTFDDGSSRVIAREVTKDNVDDCALTLTTIDSKGKVLSVSLESAPREVLNAIDKNIPIPYHRSGDGWTDGRSNYTLRQILEMFPEAKKSLPTKYRQALSTLPENVDPSMQTSVFFIETNRLIRQSIPSVKPSRLSRRITTRGRTQILHAVPDPDDPEAEEPSLRVEQYSNDLVRRVRSVLADYARHSQERDRTFPERLVRFLREKDEPLDGRLILDRMSEIESKRHRLVSLGFLDKESGLPDLKETDVKIARQALTIYVTDVEEKLRVFDGLADRVGALMDIINERFRFKRLTFHRDYGFRVVTDKKKVIDISNLSSGEQHELVLLYELLFRVPKKALVLIDEPEISLHVAWQSRFLSDLIDMLELADAYAIVATHSPVIIGPRQDLAIELKPKRIRKRTVYV